ncbi:hypothetical protein V8F20_009365 [Naviculisporaceae sp. PSN 640]
MKNSKAPGTRGQTRHRRPTVESESDSGDECSLVTNMASVEIRAEISQMPAASKQRKSKNRSRDSDCDSVSSSKAVRYGPSTRQSRRSSVDAPAFRKAERKPEHKSKSTNEAENRIDEWLIRLENGKTVDVKKTSVDASTLRKAERKQKNKAKSTDEAEDRIDEWLIRLENGKTAEVKKTSRDSEADSEKRDKRPRETVHKSLPAPIANRLYNKRNGLASESDKESSNKYSTVMKASYRDPWTGKDSPIKPRDSATKSRPTKKEPIAKPNDSEAQPRSTKKQPAIEPRDSAVRMGLISKRPTVKPRDSAAKPQSTNKRPTVKNQPKKKETLGTKFFKWFTKDFDKAARNNW